MAIAMHNLLLCLIFLSLVALMEGFNMKPAAMGAVRVKVKLTNAIDIAMLCLE